MTAQTVTIPAVRSPEIPDPPENPRLWGHLARRCVLVPVIVLTPLLAVAFVLLVLVLVPPFGQAINGTRRWLRWGPVSIQPTELAKLVLVVYLADFLARRQAAIGSLWRHGSTSPVVVRLTGVPVGWL